MAKKIKLMQQLLNPIHLILDKIIVILHYKKIKIKRKE